MVNAREAPKIASGRAGITSNGSVGDGSDSPPARAPTAASHNSSNSNGSVINGKHNMPIANGGSSPTTTTPSASAATNGGVAGGADSLRYEYDDHYFMTDPEEFIYEFFPLQKEWQLLKRPISLHEFELLPFVRSLFFRYGLWFPDETTKAMIATDASGAATIRINMPTEMANRLIFHYNLKLQPAQQQQQQQHDRATPASDAVSMSSQRQSVGGGGGGVPDSIDGCALKRFVMQSVVGNSVVFRVHAPTRGDYLLDIFANAVTPKEYLAGEPMKFKSVCKFKICCGELDTVMVPLPMCARLGALVT